MCWGKGVRREGLERRARQSHGRLNILVKYHNTLTQRSLAWHLRNIMARGGMIRLHRRCLSSGR